MKLFISPDYTGPDNGDGGIRRVVEAQKRYLPEYGFTLVSTAAEADIAAVHAGSWVDVPAGVPVVAHCHGLYWAEYEWQRWHYILNDKVIETMLRADVVTAPSQWVADALRRNFYLDAPVLYHGVDLEDWEYNETPGNYVLWNKAREDAVCDPAALNELARRAVTQEFVTTFATLDAPENVRPVGKTSYEDQKQLIRNAGVYLATTRETFGIGTLEAMACGVPVLGWRFGGQAEIVTHEVDGYLAEPGNYDDLAHGLAYITKHRAYMGKQARLRLLEDFEWSERMRDYATLYAKVIAQKRVERTRPRTSVIITNYNLGEYLPRAVDSVIAQADQDWELIIVDDASNDQLKSRAVALEQSERDARVKLVQHEKNVYLAESLNDGISRAQGRYILPLDADNEIAPDTLQLLGDRLDADRDADIAYGSVHFINEAAGETIESRWPPDEFSFRDQLSHRNQIPSTSLYRKKIWERVGGYRPRCRTAEDADFWCRATSFGARPVKATDATTLIYHDREDSMSHTNTDWPWQAWYPWGVKWEQTPPGAAVKHGQWGAPGTRRVYHAQEPLISVIIPVGIGHERKVLEALDSLQAQGFTSWECIVVNDTDSAIPWVHPWATIMQTGYSAGPAKARNLGMAGARGKFFLFLDADDYLEPDALERMVLAAQREGPRAFIYSDWIIDEERRMVESKEYDPTGLLKQLEYPVTALYPISVWKDTGGFDEDYTVAWEDWDFALRVANAGYCGVRVSKPLLHYRMSAGTRREEGFKQRDALKRVVYEKWKPYIEGQEKLMACGSCGSRSNSASAYSRQASSNVTAAGQVTPDAVLLEYTGTEAGPMTFLGKSTGTKYRFGQDVDHYRRYVRGADVAGFLSLEGQFRIATSVDSPELVGVV